MSASSYKAIYTVPSGNKNTSYCGFYNLSSFILS